MLGKRLVRRMVAVGIAAGAGFVSAISLGTAIFYALLLVTPPLAASALTALLFAVIALVILVIFLRKADGDEEDEEDDTPDSLALRAVQLFRQRPILGAAAALAGGLIVLRNPALAAMVAAAFTEKGRTSRRR